MEGKAIIRSRIAKQRDSLTEKEALEKSALIAEKALGLQELQNARNIACYLSFRNEAETRPLMESLWSSGKSVFVPVVSGKRNELQWAKMEANSILSKNRFGIPEPKTAEFADPQSIDAFIVPGIAFDESGNRLGWGKGYYDKFFAQHPTRGTKIGLAYDFQVLEEIPCDERDQKMDWVLTEKRVLGRFSFFT